MKRCTVCGEIKPYAEMTKDRRKGDGHGGKCLECKRKQCREYDKSPRGMARSVINQRKYAAKHPPRSGKKRPEVVAAYRQRTAKSLRHLARRKFASAVRSGTIIRPDACQDCGAVTKVHGHHEDYSLPYVVIWVCPTCHGRRHRIPEEVLIQRSMLR